MRSSLLHAGIALLGMLVFATATPADVVLAPGPNLSPYGVPQALSAGDLNGDGHLDVVTVDGQLESYLGNGRGGFARAYRSALGYLEGRSAPLADFDGDGHLDVAAPGGYGWHPVVSFGAGDGTFSDGPSLDSGYNAHRSLVTGRVNADRFADVVVGTHGDPSGGAIDVFLGQSNRSFAAGQTFDVPDGVNDLAAGDINGDGALDLVVATGTNLQVALGVRDSGGPTGAFGAPATYATPADVVGVTDLDADGHDDVVALSGADNRVRVRLGAATGALGDEHATSLASPATASDVTFADVDDDGVPDVLVAGFADSVQVLFGNGAGGLEDPSDFPAAQYSELVAITSGDFNEDGADDALVGDEYNTRMFLMRNAPVPVASTDEIDFGTQQVDTRSAARTATLTNVGAAPLSIAAITTVGDDGFDITSDACTGATLQYSQNCSGSVAFAPFEPGDYQSALALNSNAADGVLYLPLFGTGVAAPTPTPGAAPAPQLPAPALPASGTPATPQPKDTAPAKAKALAGATATALRHSGLSGLARGRAVRLALTRPPGTIAILVRSRGSHPVTLARVNVTAKTMRLVPTSRGRRLARRSKQLSVRISATYTTTAGQTARASRMLRLT